METASVVQGEVAHRKVKKGFLFLKVYSYFYFEHKIKIASRMIR